MATSFPITSEALQEHYELQGCDFKPEPHRDVPRHLAGVLAKEWEALRQHATAEAEPADAALLLLSPRSLARARPPVHDRLYLDGLERMRKERERLERSARRRQQVMAALDPGGFLEAAVVASPSPRSSSSPRSGSPGRLPSPRRHEQQQQQLAPSPRAQQRSPGSYTPRFAINQQQGASQRRQQQQQQQQQHQQQQRVPHAVLRESSAAAVAVYSGGASVHEEQDGERSRNANDVEKQREQEQARRSGDSLPATLSTLQRLFRTGSSSGLSVSVSSVGMASAGCGGRHAEENEEEAEEEQQEEEEEEEEEKEEDNAPVPRSASSPRPHPHPYPEQRATKAAPLPAVFSRLYEEHRAFNARRARLAKQLPEDCSFKPDPKRRYPPNLRSMLASRFFFYLMSAL